MPVKLGTSGSGGAQTIGSTVKVIIEDGGENVDVEVDENGQGKMGALSVEVSGHVTQKGIENSMCSFHNSPPYHPKKPLISGNINRHPLHRSRNEHRWQYQPDGNVHTIPKFPLSDHAKHGI